VIAAQREYVPMKDRIKGILDSNPLSRSIGRCSEPGDASLPVAVQTPSAEERAGGDDGQIHRPLDGEARRCATPELAARHWERLLDLLAIAEGADGAGGRQVHQGRLADLAHLIRVLDGDKEIIGFETHQGEKRC